VTKGVPFRDAHEAVARAVKHAMGLGVDLGELPLSVLKGFHPAIGADVQGRPHAARLARLAQRRRRNRRRSR
jgi:argininosuccinate lyase